MDRYKQRRGILDDVPSFNPVPSYLGALADAVRGESVGGQLNAINAQQTQDAYRRHGLLQQEKQRQMAAQQQAAQAAELRRRFDLTHGLQKSNFQQQQEQLAERRRQQQRFSQFMRDPNVVGSLPKNIQAILPFMAPQAAGDIVAQYQARTARDARAAQNYLLQRDKFNLQKQIANSPRPRQETTEEKELAKNRVRIATDNLKSVPSITQGQRVVAQLEAIAGKGLSPKDRKAAEGNLESAIGPIQGLENVQSFVDTLPFSQTLGLSNPETNAAIRRLQSQLEILGGESQKGLGAQSEADARRIRGAIAGLTSSRNAAEFKQNLNIIRNFFERGLVRAQEAARQYPQLGEMYPGMRQQQAPQQNNRLRFNPNTGEIE